MTARVGLPRPSAAPDQIKRDLDETGLAIVPGMLSPSRCAALRERLTEQLAGEYAADVDGAAPPSPIRYVRSLIGKGEVFDDLIVDERALDLARHVLGPDVTLFGYSGNAVGPGAPGGGAHTDQIYMPADTPWPVVCNVIYMLDDFTEDNGATLVVPGSHHRSINELTPERFTQEAIPVTGPAGSALVMESRVFHSIGINHTTDVVRHAILAAYCAPFLRPQQNWSLTVPPELIEHAPPELRELLGFRIWRTLGTAGTPVASDLGAMKATIDDRANNAHTRQPIIDVGGVDWGWVAPRPDVIAELDAAGKAVR